MSNNYDIEMSLDDTLELDSVVKEWNPPTEFVNINGGSYTKTGIQTNTIVFDPDESGIFEININGQNLKIRVIDPSNIPESVLTEDLVVWYRFEDGDSTDYASNSENPTITWGDQTSYDGTINGASFNQNIGVTDFEVGSNIGAFDFNGTGGTIDSQVSNLDPNQPHTHTFWINFDDYTDSVNSQGRVTPVSLGYTSDDRYSSFDFRSGEVNWYFYGNDIYYSWQNTTNKWFHIAAAYEGGGKRTTSNSHFYVNGTKKSFTNDNTDSDPLNLPDPSPLGLGYDNGRNTAYFDGQIDDYRLYNRALTESEISNIYNSTKP